MTSEIDLSAFDLPRLKPVPDEPPLEAASAPAPAESKSDEPLVHTEPPPPARPDLKTGEVDLSGLEFVRRLRRRVAGEGAAADEAAPAEAEAPADPAIATTAEEIPPVPLVEVEQQPSARAFELGKIEENAALIERYLAWPRSPEVWQLDLDVFLGASVPGSATQNNALKVAPLSRPTRSG